MNSVKHVLYMLWWRVVSPSKPLDTIQLLEGSLLQQGKRIRQFLIDNLIYSMHCRWVILFSSIHIKGNYSHYSNTFLFEKSHIFFVCVIYTIYASFVYRQIFMTIDKNFIIHYFVAFLSFLIPTTAIFHILVIWYFLVV